MDVARVADCDRARHRDYHNCGHTALADREAVDWTVTGRRSRLPAVPCRADSWLVDEAPSETRIRLPYSRPRRI
jgi:hypothetical protein